MYIHEFTEGMLLDMVIVYLDDIDDEDERQPGAHVQVDRLDNVL